MWRLLSGDTRIILGVERYGNLFFKNPMTKELFEPKRFLSNQPGDTFYSDLVAFNGYYSGIDARFDTADYVGDKIPLLYLYLDSLFSNIPDAKIVFMLRNVFDVAASYEARANDLNDDSWRRDKRTAVALLDWRRSLTALKTYIDDGRVFPVIYEDFFFQEGGLGPLYEFLELKPTAEVQSQMGDLLSRSKGLELGRKRDLPLEAVMNIGLNAPFGGYRELVEKIRARQ
jgi:hypothetical protein